MASQLKYSEEQQIQLARDLAGNSCSVSALSPRAQRKGMETKVKLLAENVLVSGQFSVLMFSVLVFLFLFSPHLWP